MNFIKGLNNLLKPTTVNFILALCIIIILVLIYLRNRTIDLFEPPTNTQSILTSNDYLALFINKYINKIQQNNNYIKTMATQEQKIQELSAKVSNAINPST
jgi:hypothetical protein